MTAGVPRPPKSCRPRPTPRWSDQPSVPRVKSGRPRCVGWPLNVRSRFAQPGGARPPRRRRDSARCSRSWSDQASFRWRGPMAAGCQSSHADRRHCVKTSSSRGKNDGNSLLGHVPHRKVAAGLEPMQIRGRKSGFCPRRLPWQT